MWPWNSVFKKFLAQKSSKWQRHRCVSFVPQKVWDLLDYQHLQIKRFHQKIFLVFIVFLKKKKKIRCSDNRNLTFVQGSCSAETAWRPSLPQSLAVPNVSPSLTKSKVHFHLSWCLFCCFCCSEKYFSTVMPPVGERAGRQWKRLRHSCVSGD